jgi:hypothetical protein
MGEWRYSSMDSEWRWVVRFTSRKLYPRENRSFRYPLERRLGLTTVKKKSLPDAGNRIPVFQPVG